MTLAAIGFAGTAFANNPAIAVIFLSLASMGLFSFTGPFFAMLSLSLSEKQAAVGIAIVNTLANLGGFVGPTILGYLDFMEGMISIGVLLIVAFLPLLIINRKKTQLNHLVDSPIEKAN